jgi:hypothetical protein
VGLHAQELILPSGQIFDAPLQKDMSSLINQLKKAALKNSGKYSHIPTHEATV